MKKMFLLFVLFLLVFADAALAAASSIHIDASASPAPAWVGGQITYTFTVSNTGDVITTGTYVFDVLAYPSTLIYMTPGCTFDPSWHHNVGCLIGDLAPGQQVQLMVIVQAPDTAGLYTNQVMLWSNETAVPTMTVDTTTLVVHRNFLPLTVR